MENPFSLKDKVIVVTGATGVLGHSFINSIAEAGGIVGVLGRNEAVAKERTEAIIKKGGKAVALIADVTSEAQLTAARDKMLSEYGRIDGLVNGAGGNRPSAVVQPGDDIFKLNMEGMKEVMDLNLMGTLIPTQIFGPSLVESKGSIVNISSVSAQRTLTRVMGYSLAKAAIDSYTKWFAVELANRYGDAVRMNAIVPGFFLTEQNRTLLTTEDGGYTDRGNTILKQTPFKRFGNAEELSGCLVWLLSDASRFVTGSIINIDGGFNAFSGV
ncbi:SDR family oxidoreductase [Paradesertivirga mongoliensis]|uniref:SDR family oxidoreductase n=1 Tax=Paradesertivirga mongoliensis TaxID=2100740 RepID=A0ABW4ZGZ8_9SPHI|nr:SDR family oxidoreductase [Pedobacter mongoliensis]